MESHSGPRTHRWPKAELRLAFRLPYSIRDKPIRFSDRTCLAKALTSKAYI